MNWIKLQLADGSDLWLAPGAIFAIEKSPNENTTVVKTALEPFVVMERPEQVLDLMEEAFRPQFGGGGDGMDWTEFLAEKKQGEEVPDGPRGLDGD